jgi:hypothetical protein
MLKQTNILSAWRGAEKGNEENVAVKDNTFDWSDVYE